MANSKQTGSTAPISSQPSPTVYTPKELQPILRLSKTGVAALLHSGELRAIRVGRKWLIPAAALNEFLAKRTV